MGTSWSYDAADYLTTATACPRCDEVLDSSTTCRNCGADLTSPIAREVMSVSRTAAEAIRRRQQLIDSLPTVARAAAVPRVAVPPAARQPRPRSQAQLSVQSVLAVAGAGLVAVAAFVFTFLNPDLTDFATRTLIVGAITAVFLGGAWVLARAGLRFSAESVGALGVVFVALDVWAFATSAPLNAFLAAGIGTVVAAAGLACIAWLTRIRTWLWAGLLGISVSPALFGYAVDSPWGAVASHLAVGAAALAVHSLARRLRSRFSSTLRADRTTATVLQTVAALAVLLHLAVLDAPHGADRALLSAAVIALLALLASLSTRNGLGAAWSFATGVLAMLAVAVAALAIPFGATPWPVAVVPAGVALGAAAVTVAAGLPALPSLRRRPLVHGAWSAVLLATVPAVCIGAAQYLSSPFRIVPAEWGAPAIVGIAMGAAASWAVAALARRLPAWTERTDAAVPRPTVAYLVATSAWFGAAALLAFSSWTAWLPVTQLSLGLALAVGLTALLVRVPRGAGSPLALRVPAMLGAHFLVLLALAVAWTDPTLAVIGGTAVAAAVVVLSRTLPAGGRAVHIGAAYALALVVFARALEPTGLDILAVLCLTTALASVSAFAATMLPRLGVRYWYAILVVTAIPFAIGVLSVLRERNNWTALSTALIFALAVALVVTERPGLTRFLRASAASILVPSLAVVVTCLCAALPASGSPVALPVIAVIVAATLPLTGVIQNRLESRGIAAADARAARLWIEVSTLVTGAIAVLLSLVRAATGLDTTFLVFVIVGIGAATAGLFTRRRYAWIVASVGFTGALWSLLALVDVVVPEPYLLPPALVAAIVGAVGVARGAPGLPFYRAGLAVGVVPSLLLLAASSDGLGSWRVVGLLGGAVLLLGVSVLLGRSERLRPLRATTLAAAITAAGAGALQGIRWGWELDATGVADPELRVLPVLGLAIAATVLAGVGAALLARVSPVLARSRALYVPAALFLVLGPMTALRPLPLPVYVLIGLMAVLLCAMLLTVVRARTRDVSLPPVWFLFALAWVTAVVGWSQREHVRLEGFSLPLGAFLLVAGVLAMRPTTSTPSLAPSLASWPIGSSGSWRLLAPGLIVLIGPSVLATATDPLTERAILVIVLALAAVLIGSLLRLAAPFVLGIVVLPIENIVVFAVQIGRRIESAPWWITLATAGATLLVLAVTSERRGRGAPGMGARLRDLA